MLVCLQATKQSQLRAKKRPPTLHGAGDALAEDGIGVSAPNSGIRAFPEDMQLAAGEMVEVVLPPIRLGHRLRTVRQTAWNGRQSRIWGSGSGITVKLCEHCKLGTVCTRIQEPVISEQSRFNDYLL